MFVSDSAKPMIKLACRQAMPADTDHMSVHTRCMQHMTFAAFVYTVSDLKVINDMYCSTLIAHKAHTMKRLRQSVKELIRKELIVSFEPATQEQVRTNRTAVDLLNGVDHDLLEEDDHVHADALVGKRRVARARLLELCGGDWRTAPNCPHLQLRLRMQNEG